MLECVVQTSLLLKLGVISTQRVLQSFPQCSTEQSLTRTEYQRGANTKRRELVSKEALKYPEALKPSIRERINTNITAGLKRIMNTKKGNTSESQNIRPTLLSFHVIDLPLQYSPCVSGFHCH